YQFSVRDRVVDEPHRALARDRQRHERIRKKNGLPQRKDRQFGRNRQRPISVGDVLVLEVLDFVAHGDLIIGTRGPESGRESTASDSRLRAKSCWDCCLRKAGLRQWRTPTKRSGRLHVEEQRGGAAPLSQMSLSLLGDFLGLLAVLATD